MKARHIFAVAAGNALGFYDFLTFSFFAIAIGHAFFPSHDPATSLLAALAVFGVGFISRPVGAVVIGILGDRAGRKPAMLVSFALMGFSIVGLALTPSYAAIGIAAPVLCVLFRLLQGFALGGEVGPTTAYLIEAAPAGRRGFYGALQYMTQDFSILCAGLASFALANLLAPAVLDVWGWRIAFLLGAAIVPFALWIRSALPETLDEAPSTRAAIEEEDHANAHIVRTAALGLLIIGTGAIAAYALIYLATFAQDTLGLPQSVASVATIVTGFCGVCFDPLSGILSDRFGRKRVMMIPWLAMLVVVLPAFMAMAHYRTAIALMLATVALSVCNQLTSPTALTAITEALPRKTRSGALAIVYALAIATFGGSAQYVMKKLTVLTHNPLAPAWYIAAAIVIGFLAMLAFPETAPGRGAPGH
jgi:MHS family citrate/tricarballylate:H+ symporter-like MFS transporter